RNLDSPDDELIPHPHIPAGRNIRHAAAGMAGPGFDAGAELPLGCGEDVTHAAAAAHGRVPDGFVQNDFLEASGYQLEVRTSTGEDEWTRCGKMHTRSVRRRSIITIITGRAANGRTQEHA